MDLKKIQPFYCSVSKIFLFFLCTAPPKAFGQPASATPNYYYNRETAFLMNYAIDHTNGGIYLATNENGAIVDISGLKIWNGIAPSGTLSSSKTPSAQAIALLYFIREYHRTLEAGVTDLNALITNPAHRITTPLEILTVWAKSVADFSVVGDKFKIPTATQATLDTSSNKLFYWGRTDAAGTNGTLDGTSGSGSTESLLPWALAELALIMKEAGVASTIYQPYLDEAIEWWQWRKNTAVYVAFTLGQRNMYGSARDIYYSPLGLTLFELTNTAEYKSGPGNMTDGKPLGALPYLHAALGAAGNNPDLGSPATHSMQDGAYVSGFARAITYGKLEQRAALGYTATYSERQPFQEFGFAPLYEKGNSYPIYDLNSPSELIALGSDPNTAFEHFKGRELFASVGRSAWHYFSFQVNGGMFYAANGSNPNWPNDFSSATLKTAVKDYWDYCNTTFWDNTSGVAAWLENAGSPKFKPCFSGGVDVPLADWKAPDIAGCTHTYTAGSAVNVSITGVVDSNWQYLSYKLDDSEISGVEIVYSSNNGTTWITAAATFVSGNNYSASIPEAAVTAAHQAGHHFYFYARAKDLFGNYATCPANAQTILPETGIKTAAGVETTAFVASTLKILNPCATIPNTPSVANAINACPATTVELSTLLPVSTHFVGSTWEYHAANDSNTAALSALTVGAGTYYLFEKSSAGCYSLGDAVTIAINNCCPPTLCFPVTVTRN